MKPFFCRIGSKDNIHKELLKLIPEHKIYVEPFVGSGAIFWRKSLSDKTILNDLDKEVIDNFKNLQKTSKNPNDYNIQYTVEDMDNFISKPKTKVEDKVLYSVYRSCNRIGTSKKISPMNAHSQKQKINKINEYVEKLKGIKILNQDYKKIIQNYDSKDTFFFLDPPYENSKGLYKEYIFDYNELREIVDKIKGYFMITLNDSSNIRDIFKGYIIKQIIVKTKRTGFGGLGVKDRKELIIMNYKF